MWCWIHWKIVPSKRDYAISCTQMYNILHSTPISFAGTMLLFIGNSIVKLRNSLRPSTLTSASQKNNGIFTNFSEFCATVTERQRNSRQIKFSFSRLFIIHSGKYQFAYRLTSSLLTRAINYVTIYSAVFVGTKLLIPRSSHSKKPQHAHYQIEISRYEDSTTSRSWNLMQIIFIEQQILIKVY